MTAEFWITSLIITATPGTGVLFTLTAGVSRGRRAAGWAALGCTLGIVPHLIAAVSGAALLLSASETAFTVLKFAGVAYLLYMAWNTLRRTSTLADESTSPTSGGRIVARAVLVNLLNPKLTLFFFAFLPQFVDRGRSDVLTQMLTDSAAFMVLTLVVFLVYGLAASAARTAIIDRPRVMEWLRRIFAVSFVALSLRLALTEG